MSKKSRVKRRKAAHAQLVDWAERAHRRARAMKAAVKKLATAKKRHEHARKHQGFWHRFWSRLRPKPAPVVMFDSIDLAQIPADAEAVAGYTSGNWPTFGRLAHLFPHARHLSIAVTTSHNAECLDVEPGDAGPEQAAQWVKRQHRRGIERPVVYCSLSQAQHVVDLLHEGGVLRSHFRLWTAHYSHRRHLCGPGCGFGLKTEADATQWTDRSHGRNLDESLCAPGFFS